MASPKALINFLGDSITRGYTLTDIATQSVKYHFDELVHGAVDTGLFGYDGYQSFALAGPFTADVKPTLDNTRIKNVLVVLGGANDNLNATGDAATIAGRLQTLLNNCVSEALTSGITLTTAITTIFAAASGFPSWDESIKNAVNVLIRAGGFTADLKIDTNGSDLDDPAAWSVITNTGDGLHPFSPFNRLRAKLTAARIGTLSGLPLTAVFDCETQITSNDDLTPENIPFGGTGSKTYLWKIDGVTTGNTDAQPNLGTQSVGDHTLTLEVHTTADGTVTFDRDFTVIAVGNLGIGAITPSFSTLAKSAAQALVSSGITGTPKWFITEGPGSLSGISGNDATFNASTTIGTTKIRAEEEMWNSAAHVTSNNNNSRTWDSADGYASTSVARFNSIGDGLEQVITAQFLTAGGTGNIFSLVNSGSGNKCSVTRASSTTVQVSTTGVGDEGAPITVAANDKIRIEIGPASHWLIYKNDVLVLTTTGTYDSLVSFPMFMNAIMFVLQTLPRARFYGDGVSLFNSGEAVIETANSLPLIATAPATVAPLNASYEFVINYEGGDAPLTWSRQSGTLPAGITFNTTTHKFEGTGTVAGTYPNIVIRLTDTDGDYDEHTFSITVADPDLLPTITTTTVPNATVGGAYDQVIAASSGDAPLTWTKQSGALPAGITFNTSLHKFTATNVTAAPGVYPNIVIRVTDNDGDYDEQTFSITVEEPGLSLTEDLIITDLPTDVTADGTITIPAGTIALAITAESRLVVRVNKLAHATPGTLQYHVFPIVGYTPPDPATNQTDVGIAYRRSDDRIRGFGALADLIDITIS